MPIITADISSCKIVRKEEVRDFYGTVVIITYQCLEKQFTVQYRTYKGEAPPSTIQLLKSH